MYKIFRQIIGVLLIIIGIIGLVLPFIQGIACIIAGATLLGKKDVILNFLARAKDYWLGIIRKVRSWLS